MQADDSAVEARFGLDKDEHGRKAFEALAGNLSLDDSDQDARASHASPKLTGQVVRPGRRVKGKVVFGMSEVESTRNDNFPSLCLARWS